MSGYPPPGAPFGTDHLSSLPRDQSDASNRSASASYSHYPSMSGNASFPPSDQSTIRYDMNRYPVPAPGYGYDVNTPQPWNSNAFGPNNQFAPAYHASSRPKPQSRGRSNLPNAWLDPQMMGNGVNYGSMGPPPLGQMHKGPSIDGIDADEDLIPTAIVIKNIPFAVRKEQLVELMTQMSLPLPYAFNYHFDNGVFRGLAFANFTSADETAVVIEHMNHYELQGRRLRVEYKKMLPLQERERIEREKRERRGQLEEQHRPVGTPQLHTRPSMSSLASSHRPNTSPSPLGPHPEMPDLNDLETLQFYTQIFMFKEDHTREALVFPPTLTPSQRRIVHTLAHHMQLEHLSRGDDDQRQLHVYRPGSTKKPSPPIGSSIQSLRSDDAAAKRAISRASPMEFSDTRSTAGGSETGAAAHAANPSAANGTNQFATIRGQAPSALLGLPDLPNNFASGQSLRAAKSVADLRSYTPSPAISTSSFSRNMMPNIARIQQDQSSNHGSFNMSGMISGPASATPIGSRGDDSLINGFNDMNLRSANAESPRRLRSTWSWDQDSQQSTSGPSSAGAIGSNRGFSKNSNSTTSNNTNGSNITTPTSANPNSANGNGAAGSGPLAPASSISNAPGPTSASFDSQVRGRSIGASLPLRQPHGPIERGHSAFASRSRILPGSMTPQGSALSSSELGSQLKQEQYAQSSSEQNSGRQSRNSDGRGQ